MSSQLSVNPDAEQSAILHLVCLQAYRELLRYESAFGR
jgi:hypothetical protein